jgi:hypothetical protein
MNDAVVTSTARTPIQLTEVEFWQFRSRAEEAARCRYEAEMTPQGVEARLAGRRAAETLDALARKYGFDASVMMTFDEATLSLVPQTPPK